MKFRYNLRTLLALLLFVISNYSCGTVIILRTIGSANNVHWFDTFSQEELSSTWGTSALSVLHGANEYEIEVTFDSSIAIYTLMTKVKGARFEYKVDTLVVNEPIYGKNEIKYFKSEDSYIYLKRGNVVINSIYRNVQLEFRLKRDFWSKTKSRINKKKRWPKNNKSTTFFKGITNQSSRQDKSESLG